VVVKLVGRIALRFGNESQAVWRSLWLDHGLSSDGDAGLKRRECCFGRPHLLSEKISEARLVSWNCFRLEKRSVPHASYDRECDPFTRIGAVSDSFCEIAGQ
jgi:hypothetical protein